MDTPRYLRREGTDLIFVATDALLKRKDMKPYHGPVPFRTEDKAAAQEVVMEKVEENASLDKAAIILAIVKSIPKKFFVNPAFGRPAMPRVNEVREKAGFDVSMDEVIAAVNRLEG